MRARNQAMKQTIGLALVSSCALAAACKKTESEPAPPPSPTRVDTDPQPPSPSGDVEVRFQVAIDGATHEVTGAPIKLDDGTELAIRERPQRRYRGEGFAFDHSSRVRVGATDLAVTAASGTSMVKLLVLPRAEAESTTQEAIDELKGMTAGQVVERTRTIAGEPVAGKVVVAAAANREKELYWIPIGESDALHIEVLHELAADLADVLAMLGSIKTDKVEALPDFDVVAGGRPIAELSVDTPATVDVGGAAREIAISHRPTVRRRIGRISFEHPPSAAVAKQTNPLGSGVQIGLDNVALTAMMISGTPSELRSAIAGQGTPGGPVSANIGGETLSGTSMSMFGGAMTAEVYTVGRGAETFMVMVQYSPEVAAARDPAVPVLASLVAR